MLLLLAAALAMGVPALTGAAAKSKLPRFRHVIVVVFENRDQGQVLGSKDAPTFNRLARRYAALVPYEATTHPSLPNYLMLVSGTTGGITTDCTDCTLDVPNLVDSLEAAHMSWRTYAEGLPSPGFTAASSGRYAKKHDPFLYFRDVLASRARLARIVPFAQLGRDLARRRLPRFALVIPDLCNDMHDCPTATGDAWLKRRIVPLLGKPQLAGSVVFVIFDEGVTGSGDGRIPALALGPVVVPHSRPSALVTHPALLRTIEQAWGLPFLGASARASAIGGIWR
jgi:hypothetical protein